MCEHLLTKLSCAPCSPTAKWYTENFNIGSYDYPPDGGYGVNRTEYLQPVVLCNFYAQSIYDECKGSPLTSMAGSKYADGKTTLQEAYPEYDDDVIPKVLGVADTCPTHDSSKLTYQPATVPHPQAFAGLHCFSAASSLAVRVWGWGLLMALSLLLVL